MCHAPFLGPRLDCLVSTRRERTMRMGVGVVIGIIIGVILAIWVVAQIIGGIF
jgi:hypothetical protein